MAIDYALEFADCEGKTHPTCMMMNKFIIFWRTYSVSLTHFSIYFCSINEISQFVILLCLSYSIEKLNIFVEITNMSCKNSIVSLIKHILLSFQTSITSSEYKFNSSLFVIRFCNIYLSLYFLVSSYYFIHINLLHQINYYKSIIYYLKQ